MCSLKSSVSQLICLQYGQLVYNNILAVTSYDFVTVWDLDEIEVTFGVVGPGVAKVPKWSSNGSLRSVLEDWPLPRLDGDAVFQTIPMNTGLSLLCLQITTGRPISIYIREVETEHYHFSCDISSSRDILAYNYASDAAPREHRFVLCQTHAPDHQLLNLTSFDMPFHPYSTYFDAFSSRVVLYEYPLFHIGSFIISQP